MPHSRRARLAARLRAVRTASSPSGSDFARRLGWQQSRVSKLETGSQLPSEDDIRAWVAAAGADADTEVDLLDMLSAARVEYVAWRDTFRRSGGCGQADADRGLPAGHDARLGPDRRVRPRALGAPVRADGRGWCHRG